MTEPESLLQRIRLNNEWHARPVANMATPCRCTHQVFRRSDSAADSRTRFAELCTRYGGASPSEGSSQHMAHLGPALMKWEGHTEADSVTVLIPGRANPLFSETASAFVPQDLSTAFGTDVLCGVHVEVLKQDPESMDMEAIRAALGSNELYGGPIADGSASLWSSFHLDGEGYSRIVIVDHSLPQRAVGRYIQRVIESESYRLQAMGSLPLARETMVALTALEDELEPLMDQLSHADDSTDHEALLTRLSNMAARIEHLAAASSYRFAAARAYSRIVEQRLKELREERRLAQPRYSMFLLRSLQPAMRTCEAAERRIEELAERVARATNLLNSLVDMTQTRQTNTLIEAMSRNAAVQARLQEAVEGFSTFVISYYALGLLGYMLAGLNGAGVLPVEPKMIVAVSAPIVLLTVWLVTRWTRRKLTGDLE